MRCHPHQAVDRIEAHVLAAWADDGTLEAFEDPAHPFYLKVRWHPEGDAALDAAACWVLV